MQLKIDTPAILEETLHRLIPLSRHMGITVADYDGKRLSLKAPLAANINHQESAFGGSLFCLAALGGWGLIHLKLTEKGLDCNTVVGETQASYLKPVREEILCQVALADDAEGFFAQLTAKGRARTQVAAIIGSRDDPAMKCTARYHVKCR